MITKNDIILMLTRLSDEGIDTKDLLVKQIKSSDIDLEALTFINNNRQLELTQFYNKLRKSYNNKKSKLYINIVKNDLTDAKQVLTTLSSLNLQILLFAKNCEDYSMFLRHSRFGEINAVLLNYSKTGDLIPCNKLLDVIKTDLKVCEYMEKQ